MSSYIITDNTITILIKETPYIIDKTNSNFKKLKGAIKVGADDETLLRLVDISKTISDYSYGKVRISGDSVLYKDKKIDNSITRRILTMLNDDFDVGGLCKFMDNLYNNPSKTSIDELYLFLEACNLPITEDGHFLAYKKVTRDYKDIHSGTFDNSIGSRPSMERNEVCDDRRKTCSEGLHFASFSYMKSFGTKNDRIVIVKINPADVVSIPEDYNNAKGRCWTYEVIGEVPNDGVSEIKNDCINDCELNNNISTLLKDIKKTLLSRLYSGDLKLDTIINYSSIGDIIISISRESNYNTIVNILIESLGKCDYNTLKQLHNEILDLKDIDTYEDEETEDKDCYKELCKTMLDYIEDTPISISIPVISQPQPKSESIKKNLDKVTEISKWIKDDILSWELFNKCVSYTNTLSRFNDYYGIISDYKKGKITDDEIDLIWSLKV